MSNSDIKPNNWQKQCHGFRSSLSTINSVKGGFRSELRELVLQLSIPLLETSAARPRVRALGAAPLALITLPLALATTSAASI